ncbi:MAG: branched-chain amino acid ABC transporter substrate-binding protein [Dehalococcoidia bacterium]
MNPIRSVYSLLPLVLALALGSIVAACGGGTPTSMQVLEDQAVRSDASSSIIVPAGKPIVLGVSEPLTGPEAPAGIEDRDAVVTGVVLWKAKNGNQLKGHEIEVRAEDDGCTEDQITAQAAQRLLRVTGLVGVVGPGCSAGAKAAIPLYAQGGIVAISGSATQSDLATTQPAGRFFFRTSYRNDLQGQVGGEFIAGTLKATTAYVIDDGESYGQDLAEAARKTLESNGVAVTRESIHRGDVDFSALAKTIATASPGFVGFAGFNPEAVLLYRQLRDAGYGGPFGAGDAAASVLTFVDPVGAQAAEGVYFVGCSPTLPGDFLAAFKKVSGSEPQASAFTAHNADATTILLDAVAQVAEEQSDGSLRIDPARLRDSVRATNRQDGVSGHLAFDQYGDRTSAATDLADQAQDLGLAACQVEGGKLIQLFP